MGDELATRTVHDPDKVIAICDHASPSPSEQVSNVRIMMRRFARENGILFYENGDGVYHQIVLERTQPRTRQSSTLIATRVHTARSARLRQAWARLTWQRS